MSTSLNPVDALSVTFASNIGPDVKLVYSGSLALTTGEFIGGAGPNPFVLIPFSTPYTYSGGTLLMTLRSTGATGSSYLMDGNQIDSVGEGLGVGGDSTATSATQDSGYPITEFQFTPPPTPEPSSQGLVLLGGAILLGAALRHRIRSERTSDRQGPGFSTKTA